MFNRSTTQVPSVEYQARYFEKAKHATLSVQNEHRNLQGNLKTTWESLHTWKLELPWTTRTPIMPEVAEAIALFGFMMAFHGDTSSALQWVGFAIGVISLLEFMARPGEFLLAR